MVHRRALRRRLRAPGTLARPSVLGERPQRHRRRRAGWGGGAGEGRRGVRGALPVRLSLPLCVRDAGRHRGLHHGDDDDRQRDPMTRAKEARR